MEDEEILLITALKKSLINSEDVYILRDPVGRLFVFYDMDSIEVKIPIQTSLFSFIGKSEKYKIENLYRYE